MPAKQDKRLYLMRHGKSSWDDPTITDHDRPLNARGERDVPAMALRLKAAGFRPSLIATSSARRTTETAKLVADALNYPREFLHRERILYLADCDTLCRFVAEQDDRFQCLLLCGHNPGMTDFANRLVPRLTDNVPTSGVIGVRGSSADWRGFLDGELRLERYDTPKQPWPAG